jgi:hypothetical protein
MKPEPWGVERKGLIAQSLPYGHFLFPVDFNGLVSKPVKIDLPALIGTMAKPHGAPPRDDRLFALDLSLPKETLPVTIGPEKRKLAWVLNIMFHFEDWRPLANPPLACQVQHCHSSFT